MPQARRTRLSEARSYPARANSAAAVTTNVRGRPLRSSAASGEMSGWVRSAGDTGVGDSGNITDELDSERQKIWRFDLDGSNKRLFVSGIRNTEKLRLRPGSNEIWGADHGSDNFGARLGERMGRRQPVTDWNPPDELNHYVEGGFYGHPFIVGDKLPRYEYREREDILDLAARTTPPVGAEALADFVGDWRFAA